MNKTARIILLVLLIVFIMLFISFSCFWYRDKQARVKSGTARANFPYSDYSLDELNKMYPQYIENTAPTTQTPEQTHAKFIDALKKGDFDEAVKCCVVENKQIEIRNFLLQVKNTNKLKEMINDLERDFRKESIDNEKAVFSFSLIKDGENYGHFVYFVKDSNGVWLIESL